MLEKKESNVSKYIIKYALPVLFKVWTKIGEYK